MVSALGLVFASLQPVAATDYAIATPDDDLAGNGNCTLREALAAAVSNAAVDACPAGSAIVQDTISLAAGTYLLPLGVLDVSGCADLLVRGPAAALPTAVLSGGTTHRVFDLLGGGNLTLEDLEIRDGRDLGAATPIGAAVRAIEASLTVRRVRFFSNIARRGGAIGWAATGDARSLVIEASVFEQNRAQHPDAADATMGGALWTNGVSGAGARISDTLFVDNRAESALASDFIRSGAAELGTEGSGSTVTVERTRFIGNSVEATGSGSFVTAGALNGFFQGSTVRFEDVEVQGSLLLAGTPFGASGRCSLSSTRRRATSIACAWSTTRRRCRWSRCCSRRRALRSSCCATRSSPRGGSAWSWRARPMRWCCSRR